MNLIKNIKKNEKLIQVFDTFFECMKFNIGRVYDTTLDTIEKNYNLLNSFRSELIKQ
jgi:hypothetical protein